MRKELFWFLILALVLPKGVVTPLTVCLRLDQNAKQTSGYLINLFYILCRHFDEKKKKRGVPLTQGYDKSSKSEGMGCYHLKYFKSPFWKKICMIWI